MRLNCFLQCLLLPGSFLLGTRDLCKFSKLLSMMLLELFNQVHGVEVVNAAATFRSAHIAETVLFCFFPLGLK